MKKKKFTIKENVLNEQNWLPPAWEIEREIERQKRDQEHEEEELQLPNPNDEAEWYWDPSKEEEEDEDTEKRGIEIIDLYGEGKLRLKDILTVRPALVSPHLFAFNGKASTRLSEGIQLNGDPDVQSENRESHKGSQPNLSKLIFNEAPTKTKTPNFSKMKVLGRGSSRIVYESSKGVYKVPRKDRWKWGAIGLKEELDLTEGGYSKLMRSLTGQDKSINTIGIVTAENPFAKELPPQENKRRNKMLAQALRQAGYGFYQIQGKYGNVKKPYVIPNISRDDLLFLGKKFEQESVIYVEKQDDGQMKAELLYTDGSGNAAEPRSVVLPIAQDQDDFYSIYKGRKFVIPFFDDLFSGATMSGGKVNFPNKSEELIFEKGMPEPDASTRDPFGKYLFDTKREDLPKEAQYPMTKFELQFFASLQKFIEKNDDSDLRVIFPKVWKLTKKGKYQRFLVPKDKPIYRGFSFSHESLSEFLASTNLEAQDLEVADGEERLWVFENGTLTPLSNRKIMSWSIDPGRIKNFTYTLDYDVFIKTMPTDDNGMFLLNPEELNSKVRMPSLYKRENEVMSYGPVKYEKMVVLINYGSKEHYTRRSVHFRPDFWSDVLTNLK